jgi:uncharacterized protein (TIGR03067 family)
MYSVHLTFLISTFVVADLPHQSHDFAIQTGGIQGTWNLFVIGQDGEPQRSLLTMTISADTFTIHGGRRPEIYRYKLGTIKSREIDYTVPRGVGKAAIYCHDGDRLLFCWSDTGPRPEKFKYQPEHGIGLWILERNRKSSTFLVPSIHG